MICEDSSHLALQIVSAALVAGFSCGLPLIFCTVLVSRARKAERQVSSKLALMLHSKLGVDQRAAEYVLRDLEMGDDYTFLTAAYEPKYLYWEALDSKSAPTTALASQRTSAMQAYATLNGCIAYSVAQISIARICSTCWSWQCRSACACSHVIVHVYHWASRSVSVQDCPGCKYLVTSNLDSGWYLLQYLYVQLARTHIVHQRKCTYLSPSLLLSF